MLGWLWRPLAAASTMVVSTAAILSTRYERVRLYYHLGLYLTTLGAASVWGLLITVMATATGQRFNINYYVARSFYHVASPLTGIKLELEGGEHLECLHKANNGKGQSAVLIGNHQSVLDILYLGRILPKRSAIMAKKELIWTPILGQYMALSGAVLIDRKNRKSAFGALEQAGRDMKKRGVSLWIFPEGTRSQHAEPSLLPFKKGAFHLAVQAQVPIVAVVCENYHRLFDGRTRMNSGVLKLRVLPPIPTEGLGPDDVNALTESVRETMLEALREISEPGPAKISEMSDTDNPVVAPEAVVAAPITSSGTQEVVQVGEESHIESTKTSEDEVDTTEDEMDEDAVLLKRPTDFQAA